MEPELRIGRLKVEMADPTFQYNTTHVVHVPVENPTPQSYTYTLEVYLALSEAGTKVATGSTTFTLGGGQSDTEDISLTMPDYAGGPYSVYIDAKVAGVVVGAYIATETVMVEVTPQVIIHPITWD